MRRLLRHEAKAGGIQGEELGVQTIECHDLSRQLKMSSFRARVRRRKHELAQCKPVQLGRAPHHNQFIAHLVHTKTLTVGAREGSQGLLYCFLRLRVLYSHI
jgi:hypothetical protein